VQASAVARQGVRVLALRAQLPPAENCSLANAAQRRQSNMTDLVRAEGCCCWFGDVLPEHVTLPACSLLFVVGRCPASRCFPTRTRWHGVAACCSALMCWCCLASIQDWYALLNSTNTLLTSCTFGRVTLDPVNCGVTDRIQLDCSTAQLDT
jgi:hypothetical protein